MLALQGGAAWAEERLLGALSGSLSPKTAAFIYTLYQEPLNAPFLNGLFSRGFSREKTAH